MRVSLWFGLLSSIVWLSDAQVADACGACVGPPVDNTSSPPPLVAAHRMAMSVSNDQTILWDQIRYTGEASDFAWILPVKPGTRVELASNAWLDAMDATTAVRIVPPVPTCEQEAGCQVAPGFAIAPSVGPLGLSMGCGTASSEASSVEPDQEVVDVVARKSEGPYEMVILSGEDGEALTAWLSDHGFQIPEDFAPIVSAYAAEGFDFAALRLVPGAGTEQMTPVRVVQPGASPTLPLRMVQGGAGARTPMTLFVISEGPLVPSNMPTARIDPLRLSYDFLDQTTNYAELRAEAMAEANNATWVLSYARQGALFDRFENPSTDATLTYRTSNGWTFETFLHTYLEQAFSTGETAGTQCADALEGLLSDPRKIVLPCEGCEAPDPNEAIDARTLACDPPIGSDIPFDDLSMALVGMHPKDVWVTRLDANLARSAMAFDLQLTTPSDPAETSQFLEPFVYDDSEICPASAKIVRSRTESRAAIGFGLAFAALALTARLRVRGSR